MGSHMSREMPPRRPWRIPPPLPTADPELADVPPVIARVLRNRGLNTRPEVDRFLSPVLHDPQLLPNMEPACDRLRSAVMGGEAIGVFGDFDVDGVTGTAVMAQGLRALGATVVPYIPDRVSEGHGLNPESVQVLRNRGVSVLITVDCGITSVNEVSIAQELGMDVIITDHHVPPETQPPAHSVISARLESSEYPFLELSGAGLALKLVQGLYSLMGRTWDRDLLELAALSTVADLVPLQGENRLLVREGVKELRRTRRPGLLALYRHAGIQAESIDAETIAFSIAPRLNAAGRLEHASTSLGLLITESADRAEELAAKLEALNVDRRQLTEEAWTRARDEVMGWGAVPPMILVSNEELSPGIAGLVASRLVDQFHRPAVVMSQVDGMLMASARSIPGFDLMADALSHCPDLFKRHGGHSQAAGFLMLQANLPALEERMVTLAGQALEGRDLEPTLDIDAEVSVASLAGETFRWLKDLEPYGVNNHAPTFLTRNLRVLEARPMGGNGQHLRLKLKEGRVVWDAVAFRQGERWVQDTESLDAVYTIGAQRRGGSEVLALNLMDFRSSAV